MLNIFLTVPSDSSRSWSRSGTVRHRRLLHWWGTTSPTPSPTCSCRLSRSWLPRPSEARPEPRRWLAHGSRTRYSSVACAELHSSRRIHRNIIDVIGELTSLPEILPTVLPELSDIPAASPTTNEFVPPEADQAQLVVEPLRMNVGHVQRSPPRSSPNSVTVARDSRVSICRSCTSWRRSIASYNRR